MRHQRPFVAALAGIALLVASLALAACGNGGGGSATAQPSSTPLPPATVAGAWKVQLKNCKATGGLTCDNPDSLHFTMDIQQTGSKLTVNFGGNGTGTGTASGQSVSMASSPQSFAGSQTCIYTLVMTGSVLATDQMGGKYHAQCTNEAGSVWATVQADWTATLATA